MRTCRHYDLKFEPPCVSVFVCTRGAYTTRAHAVSHLHAQSEQLHAPLAHLHTCTRHLHAQCQSMHSFPHARRAQQCTEHDSELNHHEVAGP